MKGRGPGRREASVLVGSGVAAATLGAEMCRENVLIPRGVSPSVAER
jgi:hypothetical protein